MSLYFQFPFIFMMVFSTGCDTKSGEREILTQEISGLEERNQEYRVKLLELDSKEQKLSEQSQKQGTVIRQLETKLDRSNSEMETFVEQNLGLSLAALGMHTAVTTNNDASVDQDVQDITALIGMWSLGWCLFNVDKCSKYLGEVNRRGQELENLMEQIQTNKQQNQQLTSDLEQVGVNRKQYQQYMSENQQYVQSLRAERQSLICEWCLF